MEHCLFWKRLASSQELRLRPELSDDTLKLIEAGDRVLNVFTVTRMGEQRGIDQLLCASGGEVRPLDHRLRHGLHAIRQQSTQPLKRRLRQKVAVCLAVQNRELIPEQGDHRQRGAKDRLARMLVQTPVDAELVHDERVHRPNPSHRLSYLIAKAVCLTNKLVRGLGGLGKAEKLGNAPKNDRERPSQIMRCQHWLSGHVKIRLLSHLVTAPIPVGWQGPAIASSTIEVVLICL
jgi:hypothetical protein